MSPSSLIALAAAAALGLAACRGRPTGEQAQGKPAPAPAAQATEELHGTVTRAGPGQVVIRPQGASNMTLRVDDGTTVTVDGQPSAPDRLRPGTEVRAAYQAGPGGQPTAIRIEAQSVRGANVGSTNPRATDTANKAHGGVGTDQGSGVPVHGQPPSTGAR